MTRDIQVGDLVRSTLTRFRERPLGTVIWPEPGFDNTLGFDVLVMGIRGLNRVYWERNRVHLAVISFGGPVEL